MARNETDNLFAARYIDSDHSEGRSAMHLPIVLAHNVVSESVFSDHTGQSGETDISHDSGFQSISKSQVVQPLSPSSFVTQKTEVTVSSSSSIRASEQYAAVVHISAEGCPIEALGSPNKM